MRRALDEYQILGVTTNLDLHRALMNSPRFFGGQVHTRFLEEERLTLPPPEDDEVLAAALAVVLADWRRRAGSRREETISRWKLLGRWEQLS